ncbi:NfeD family protein [Thermomonospora umbrina]|uniref:Membrane protein implicated in regulation of membrane protease activity n=1 Tax=Thermomonospora umbrina TaxID=111806 RepID=A0A3D9SNP0_9ACTN|nr:NfeD family protein [Thermomonospora umbrina]REE97549.1 membrane protein implicated in regulation of membrane protease activity [Thermomonospora umbrina]
MEAWVIWLIVAAVLGVVELFTLTLALGLLSAAALAAGLTAAVGLPPAAQAVVFVATSAAGLFVVRPIAQRQIRRPPPLRSGTAALIGREALTLTDVTKHAGRVRIGGEEWTARPYDPDLVISAGTEVDVLGIEGVTALVYPRE